MTKRHNVAYAPYNFVPFPEEIIHRYKCFSELPSHDLSRKEDQALLSGEITFDIVAESPILVADGNKKDSEFYDFVKNAREKYEIPGSTLRGLIRNSLSVLSMSDWSKRIDEERYYYRMVGESSSRLAQTYHQTVDSSVEVYRGKRYSIAKNVKAGYLVKIANDKYVIYPARTDGGRKGRSYYKYHISQVNDRFKGRIKRFINEGFQVEDCRFAVNKDGKATYLNGRDAPFEGKKIFSGPMKGRTAKQSFYIINEIDKDAKPINISPSQLRAYKADYEFRKSKFPKGKKETMEEYFSLPKEIGLDNAKPCFYLQRGEQLYFGFTAFLRLTYDYTTRDAIPDHIKHSGFGIDYEKALFGFVEKDFAQYSGKNKPINYASRLSFFPSELSGEAGSKVKTKVTLRSPRASALQMYLDQDLNKAGYKSYNDKDAQVRGMKQYWVKNILQDREGANELHLLPRKSVFQAKIKFEHLHRDELGVLLWTLQGPQYHQIGMGKPYGYGLVRFTNLNCKTTNPSNMYQDLNRFFQLGFEQADIESLIKDYKNYVKEKFSINLDKQESIQVFLKMKEKAPLSDKDMAYMPLRGGYSKKPKLPTARDLLEGKYRRRS